MPRFYPHPIIAREGWPFISAGLVLSIIVTACAGWWSLPFWLFTAFALQFFRDPSRPIPQDADAVLCPADGRIVVVEKVLDPYRNVEALKISEPPWAIPVSIIRSGRTVQINSCMATISCGYWMIGRPSQSN